MKKQPLLVLSLIVLIIAVITHMTTDYTEETIYLLFLSILLNNWGDTTKK